MEQFDLIVIGGGSGGSATAKRSAEYGATVAIIERGHSYDENGVRQGAGFGGTCVNVGCVPKKLMFNAAMQREAMVGSVSTAQGYGYTVPASAGTFDWAKVKEKRDAYVGKLNKGYKGGWEKAGCTVIQGLASFSGPKTVTVATADGGTRTLTADKICIACGGKPAVPPIPGAEYGISSDGFFDLATQPKKCVVVGAGYIAVEMAGILHGLGTEAHLAFRGKTVLRRGFDPFIVETLMAHMADHGPILHPESDPKSVTKDAATGLMTVEFKSGETIEGCDCVLFATGRKPVTDSLNLEAANVATERGYITVDKFEATSVPGIWAIGDATTTGYELTPVAIAAGRRLGDRLFGGLPETRIEYNTIATVVFSHPPIGMIGLTEPDAKKEYGEDAISTKYARFPSMLYAFNEDGHKVKTGLKLVLKMPEERVVGLHCIGPFSDEMMQGFAVAVRMGATRMDFEASVAIHPTIAEEFVTFGGWGQVKDEASGKRIPYMPPYLKKGSDGLLVKATITLCAGIAVGFALAKTVFSRR